MDTQNNLYFLPLGGAGEIGMNLNLYGYGPSPEKASWIIVDIGVSFSSSDRAFGIEMVMADPEFIQRNRKKLLGIVLTHAHEDHIGAASHLWERLQCPIYATPFTSYLLRDKFLEKGVPLDPILNTITTKIPIQLGPFDIQFMEITHSTLESNALIIKTPLGTVFHTGDWKIDPQPVLGTPIDFGAMEQLGREGILATICDSTNALTEGHSGSEGALAESLESLIATIPGGLAVTTFASNIARLQTLMTAAKKANRKVVLVGRSMYRAMNAARDTGYIKDSNEIISEDSIANLDKRDYMLICTGSQGESRAALTRIANGTHRYIRLGKEDTVIFSSRIIPGNDLEIFALQNKLASQGIHVITERDHFVHVSGHPCRRELEELYNVLKPSVAVPVHGEMRHMLEHVSLAKDVGVPHTPLLTNGDILHLAPGEPYVMSKKVHSGRLYLDGRFLIKEDNGALKERRILARQGLIVINLVLDKSDNLVEDPSIHFIGIPLAAEEMRPIVTDAVYDFMESLVQRKKKFEESDLQKGIAKYVQTAVASVLGKQPMVRVYFVKHS